MAPRTVVARPAVAQSGKSGVPPHLGRAVAPSRRSMLCRVSPGSEGGRDVRIPFRDPGWVATVGAGVVALGLAASILALRVFGTSELAVIPTESWPWSSESVGVDGVGSQSQFRAGDRVAGMDGIPMSTWGDDALAPPWVATPATVADVV